jgi:hypothetical protein
MGSRVTVGGDARILNNVTVPLRLKIDDDNHPTLRRLSSKWNLRRWKA